MHTCPGGCGQQVRDRLFACKTDWYRLPASIRNRINDAFFEHGVGSEELFGAHKEAIEYYAEHPRQTA